MDQGVLDSPRGESNTYISLLNYKVTSRTKSQMPQIGSIMKMLSHHTTAFTHLCQPSPTLFLSDITVKLLTMMNQGAPPKEAAASVQQHILLFEDLRDNLRLLENGILMLVGCGKELQALEQTLHQVNTVVAWLEDLYCICYEGHGTLDQEHGKLNLLYQRQMKI